LVNKTAFPHAMHLHGHHFRVIERNGKPVAGAPWRDTELVERNEQVRIAFVADNPGKWLFHCHMLEHVPAGMVTWIEVG
jgi:FtsP/CotA-like multicopper oxidase with cupredoxin domain